MSRRLHVPPTQHITDLLAARGPDAQQQVEITITDSNGADAQNTFITCYSTVLQLRGEAAVAQPLQQSKTQSALCWNGEAWTIGGVRVLDNDTDRVFNLLSTACEQIDAPQDHSQLSRVARSLSRIAGPYAFVYYDELSKELYFGRDFLGRRSLLWSITDDGDILLASATEASPGEAWSEVEADGVYCAHLASYVNQSGDDSMPWGNFTVSKVPYLFIGDDSDNAASVGTRRFTMRRLAHGEVGVAEAFLESANWLPSHNTERAVTVSG